MNVAMKARAEAEATNSISKGNSIRAFGAGTDLEARIPDSCIAEVSDKVLDAASFFWEKMRGNMFHLFKKHNIDVPKAEAIKGKKTKKQNLQLQ